MAASNLFDPRDESSTDQFLRLIQDPFQSAFQESAFWASLGSSIGVLVALTLLFSLFRPRHTIVYAPKVKHADQRHAPPPMGKGIFAWVKPILKTNEQDLVDRIGLDATVFLRFTKMCRNLFLFMSLMGCCIMIPVNLAQSSKAGGNVSSYSVFDRMTPLYVGGEAMWSYVVCAWVFDILVAYFLWRNYRGVRDLRKRHFQSSDYQRSLHARTLMITEIPADSRNDERLLRIVEEVNPSPAVPRVAIGRNVKELPKLIAEHEEMVRDLESVLAKYLKRPDRLPANRPTMRPRKTHKGVEARGKVDAIDYLTQRIAGLEAEIQDVRDSVDKRHAMPYGFASWEEIGHAHAAAYVAQKKHPQGTTIRLAPKPNDIIWDNLPLSSNSRRWKRIVNMFWVSLLTVVWIAPNAMIAIFLTDLSNLGLVWKTFQTELNKNPRFWSGVQGIVSPVITSLIYLVLPIIFRRLSMRAGDTTKTSRERHVIAHLYSFFVFNNLIVFSVFSAIWGFVAAVIDKENDEDVWSAIRDGNFYTRIVNALCTVSPFFVSWLLQRNYGAAIDLVQLINLGTVWFCKTFLSPTPRQAIEWTAPPPFEYASYYNYFLYYATVALCFATLQPIVLPITALYFAVDAWLKKYLLMYVFVTKTESDGRFWRVLFNRMLFAAVLANFIVGLVVKSRGTWTMVFALVPLPFLMLGFKWYCARTFDDELQYLNRGVLGDSESLAEPGQKHKKAGDRLAAKFGHPALYKRLPTPMVHAKAAEALRQIYRGRLGPTDDTEEYSDIAMTSMSTERPGKKAQPPSNAPFEVVAENQLDFSYFRERSDFNEFGGGIYGRPEDLISERSHTPKSFMGDRAWSPSSSRASSPTPSLPETRPPIIRPGLSTAPSEMEARGIYRHSNDSERQLLSNAQPVAETPEPGLISMDRWRTDRSAGYGPVHQDDPTSYDGFRGAR